MATDYAALVTELRVGRKWGQVAALCNGRNLGHPGAYYQRISTGELKRPHLAARNGIIRAARKHAAYALTAVNGTFNAVSSLGVSIGHPLGTRVNQWRQAHSMTWDQWHEKAHELMRREYGEGREE